MLDVNIVLPPSTLKNGAISELLDMATGQDHGFAYIRLPNHPLANKSNGKVYVSRLLASSLLGRWLLPDEVVRFHDRNPANLQPENLYVVTRSEHMNRMASLKGCAERIELSCAKCGEKFMSSPSRARWRVTCGETCRIEHSRRFNLEAIELRLLVWTTSAAEVGRLLGVSDRAIGKRCARLGIPKPARGDWQRYKTGYLSENEWFEMMCQGLEDDEIAVLAEDMDAILERYDLDGYSPYE